MKIGIAKGVKKQNTKKILLTANMSQLEISKKLEKKSAIALDTPFSPPFYLNWDFLYRS